MLRAATATIPRGRFTKMYLITCDCKQIALNTQLHQMINIMVDGGGTIKQRAIDSFFLFFIHDKINFKYLYF